MNVSEALNRAADHLEVNGWMSMAYCPRDQPLATCAHVAIGEVTQSADGPADRAFWTYLGGTGCDAIWAWNDAPDRTAAEVVEALRACAVIQASREAETDVRAVSPREGVGV